MDRNVFLLDSPAIERAVMTTNGVTKPNRRPGRSSLDEMPVSAGGGGAMTYNGYFKLTFIDQNTVGVVNGSDYGSEFCGVTDLPGAENVAAVTFPLDTLPSHQFYLYAYYVDGVFGTSIVPYFGATNRPPGTFDSIYLGGIFNGRAHQAFFSYDPICYAKDWYL